VPGRHNGNILHPNWRDISSLAVPVSTDCLCEADFATVVHPVARRAARGQGFLCQNRGKAVFLLVCEVYAVRFQGVGIGLILNNPFGYPDRQWSQAKRKARAVLAEAAREESTIAYSELLAAIHAIRLEAYDVRLKTLLGQISEDEDGAGRRMLPWLWSTRKVTSAPVRNSSNGGTVRLHGGDRAEFWIMMLTKVYTSWQGKPPRKSAKPERPNRRWPGTNRESRQVWHADNVLYCSFDQAACRSRGASTGFGPGSNRFASSVT
jgi:hypothetical protein